VGVEKNPGPHGHGRLTTEERWRVVHLSVEQHLSARAIARRMHIARNTVASTLKRYVETGDVEEREGRGGKRKLSDDDEKKIVKKAKTGKTATVITRELFQEAKISVHVQTVLNILHKHKFSYKKIREEEAISEAAQQTRLQYARQMIGYDWKQVVFSDEKTFWLGSGVSHSWQEEGTHLSRKISKHPPKLHVWAAAGFYYKAQLYFFTQNMDAELYQTIIKARLLEKKLIYARDCPRRYKGTWVYLQDNDPKHKAASTMRLLEGKVGEERIINHPPYSPDLNIMENLWAHLNRQIQAARVTTISGLKRKLTQEWVRLSWDTIRVCVLSMPARLQECIQVQGARTQY
jgi:transposase